MPNWCQNEVEITGDEATIKQVADIINANEEQLFQMNDFVPMPQHLDGTTSPDGSDNFQEALNGNRSIDYTNWYDWRLANWGTKWDLDENTQHDISDGRISLGFDTAWSPNDEFWVMFSQRYPSLVIKHNYLEEGMCFIGEATYTAGEEVYNHHSEITDKMYIKAGAIVGEDGEIDWDNEDNQCLNLWDVFPLEAQEVSA